MHDRVRRIAERADAYEHEPGYGQQQRQDGDTQREMRDVAVIGGGAGAFVHLMACPLYAFGGDQLRDGEVADDDDARSGEHQRRVEHAGRERGAVAELREIVVVPVRVVGGQAGGAHAGNHEERQQRGQRLRVHHLRLHERHITDDAREAGADGGEVSAERRRPHHAVDCAE